MVLGSAAGSRLAALIAGLAAAQAGSLKIESWRNDDADIWNNTIIPAFQKHYPDIKIEFSATQPADYDAALNAKLDGGTAGDLITCRPFDRSLQLYQKHELDGSNDLKGLDNFPDVAKAAWSTDDGKTTFCVPMASVIHGFMYNEDAFKKIGAKPPKTMAEFHDILDKLKKDGTYTPIDMGTADQWEAATMGFQNIGPDYWKGETGRAGLIAGKEKYSDPQYVAVFKELASWAPYMGIGLPGAEISRQPEPVLARQGRDLSGRLVGHLDLPQGRAVPDRRLPAAAARGRYGVLHLRPYRHRHGRERSVEEQGGCEEIPRMAGDAGVRGTLRQCAAGIFPAQQGVRHDQGSARGRNGRLAQGLQVDDPQLLPDPEPRHAEPRERTLGRVGAGHERRAGARRGRQAAAGRPRQVVQAAAK